MEPSKPSKAHDGNQSWSQPQYNVWISIFGLGHITCRYYDRCQFCGLYDLAAFGLWHCSFRFGERYDKYLFCHFFVCKEKNHKLTSVLNYLYSNHLRIGTYTFNSSEQRFFMYMLPKGHKQDIWFHKKKNIFCSTLCTFAFISNQICVNFFWHFFYAQLTYILTKINDMIKRIMCNFFFISAV